MDMMETIELKDIESQVKQVFRELLEAARLKPGQLLVVGCSSSEIDSFKIGSHSSAEIGMAVYRLFTRTKAKGNLSGCPVLRTFKPCPDSGAEAAQAYGYEPVNVVPQLKAGGSFATAAYATLEHPVAVERHQGPVRELILGIPHRHAYEGRGSPVRIKTKEIGSAHVVCARTRPKFIGGIRARYDEENM